MRSPGRLQIGGLPVHTKTADMERGHIRLTRQKLPVLTRRSSFQPPSHPPRSDQVELSFRCDNAMDVIRRWTRTAPFSEGSAYLSGSLPGGVCTTSRGRTGRRTSTSGCPSSASKRNCSRLGNPLKRRDQRYRCDDPNRRPPPPMTSIPPAVRFTVTSGTSEPGRERLKARSVYAAATPPRRAAL